MRALGRRGHGSDRGGDARSLERQLTQLTASAVQRALLEQDADPCSPTYGCFDRRYWGWKLVDLPEATFQRNVVLLAWAAQRAPSAERGALLERIVAGLRFSAHIQGSDGSFDQAFPRERSFGATAFLVPELHDAYSALEQAGGCDDRAERCLRLAAGFLCEHEEEHGLICNHLAGAVLALELCARRFREPRLRARADELLERVLVAQSREGWFPEYGAADPGYQTLCVHYLARVLDTRGEDPRLERALRRSSEFLSHFAHPDGSFAGEYGARRTAVVYLGGLARLARRDPLSASLFTALAEGVVADASPSPASVDMGNLAPLASSTLQAAAELSERGVQAGPPLPWERDELRQDFPLAGLYVRGTSSYYCVVGVSNGGVFKLFRKADRSLLYQDSGYVGELASGGRVTTQATRIARPCHVEGDELRFAAPLVRLRQHLPTPSAFVALRLSSLTLLRSRRAAEALKRLLVSLLVQDGSRDLRLRLRRRLRFEPSRVVVSDRLEHVGRGAPRLRSLGVAHRFVSIHMASARYYGAERRQQAAPRIDIEALNDRGLAESSLVLEVCDA